MNHTTHRHPRGARFAGSLGLLALLLILSTQAIAWTEAGWPATPEAIRTTSGDTYLANLNGQINALSHHPNRTTAAPMQVRLGVLLYHRFQLEGRIDDAEAALRHLTAAQDSPGYRPSDHLALVQVLMGFHQFDAARASLDAAAAAGAPAEAVAMMQAALNRSLELPPVDDRPVQPGGYVAAVQVAAVQTNRGSHAAATRWLQQAQERYTDSSPYPLAWIHVQQGIAHLRRDDLENARRFFAAAHARLPQYFLATEHLAEVELALGHAETAARLYRDVIAQNDQPAFWHGLALAEAALGNEKAAQEAAAQAASKYEALLERHPLMFADHAVDYYLDTGQPERALELAEINFAARQDVSAHLAMVSALMAHGREAEAEALLKRLDREGLAPPEV